MVSELIEKYVWIVQTLIDAGPAGLTFEQLRDKWEKRFREAYSRRTFNNHRTAVEEVFGVWISCRRTDNTYYIDGGKEVLDKDRSTGWMISTFTVGSLLSMGKERLRGRVSLENIPSGQIYLAPILSAMTELKELEIGYEKYGKTEVETFHIHPFAVKEFQSRWYVVGWCRERDAMRLYGLDRICSLETTGKSFSMPSEFDVEDLFYRSFGPYITTSRDKVERIVLRTGHRDSLFLKDLPIHHTQKVISEGAGTVDFEISLVPNDNFFMELMKYGSRIEVLSPGSVRERLAQELRKAAEQYNQNTI